MKKNISHGKSTSGVLVPGWEARWDIPTCGSRSLDLNRQNGIRVRWRTLGKVGYITPSTRFKLSSNTAAGPLMITKAQQKHN